MKLDSTYNASGMTIVPLIQPSVLQLKQDIEGHLMCSLILYSCNHSSLSEEAVVGFGIVLHMDLDASLELVACMFEKAAVAHLDLAIWVLSKLRVPSYNTCNEARRKCFQALHNLFVTKLILPTVTERTNDQL
jgi:hypothetical protein